MSNMSVFEREDAEPRDTGISHDYFCCVLMSNMSVFETEDAEQRDTGISPCRVQVASEMAVCFSLRWPMARGVGYNQGQMTSVIGLDIAGHVIENKWFEITIRQSKICL